MEVDEFVLPPNVKPAWLMPYLTNRGITPTDNLPTYAGFSRSLGHRDGGQRDGFHGCWLMRFADKKYYSMVPAVRKREFYRLTSMGAFKLVAPRAEVSEETIVLQMIM